MVIFQNSFFLVVCCENNTICSKNKHLIVTNRFCSLTKKVSIHLFSIFSLYFFTILTDFTSFFFLLSFMRICFRCFPFNVHRFFLWFVLSPHSLSFFFLFFYLPTYLFLLIHLLFLFFPDL